MREYRARSIGGGSRSSCRKSSEAVDLKQLKVTPHRGRGGSFGPQFGRLTVAAKSPRNLQMAVNPGTCAKEFKSCHSSDLFTKLLTIDSELQQNNVLIHLTRKETKVLADEQLILQEKIQREQLLSAADQSLLNDDVFLKLSDQTENIKSQIEDKVKEKNSALSKFGENAQEWAKQFSGGPMEHGIERVSQDIDNINLKLDEVWLEIDKEYNPVISTANSELEKKLITIIEIPGSAPSKVNNTELQVMINKITESAEELDEGIVEAVKEIELLKEREALLGNIP